jgi:hypothetical protein
LVRRAHHRRVRQQAYDHRGPRRPARPHALSSARHARMQRLLP